MSASPTKLAAAEAALRKVPEGTLAIAIEYAGMDKPETWARSGSMFMTPKLDVRNVLDDMLKEKGLTNYDFVMSLSGTGCSPGDLHAAVQTVGIDVAQGILDRRLAEAEKAGRAPVEIASQAPAKPAAPAKIEIAMPEDNSREAKLLNKLAETSPAGFRMALAYVNAGLQNPGLQLDAHLTAQGIQYSDYMDAVKNSGDTLQAMRKKPELAQHLAGKLPPEQKTPVAVEAQSPAKIEMPEDNSREAKLLNQLAETSPAGYRMALAYVNAGIEKPGLQLDAHLTAQGIQYSEYMNAVKNSADTLQAMRKKPELAQHLAEKLPPEQKAPVATAPKAKAFTR